VLGLSLGRSQHARAIASYPLPTSVIAAAVVMTIGFFGLRLCVLSGVELRPDVLFNKWHLGPARLVNMACLALVFVRVVRHLVPASGARALSLLGRASLPVFCAHIVLCLLAYTIVGDLDIGLAAHEEVLILVFTFSALFMLALQRDAAKAGRLEQRTV
jgi:hypothetical protein